MKAIACALLFIFVPISCMQHQGESFIHNMMYHALTKKLDEKKIKDFDLYFSIHQKIVKFTSPSLKSEEFREVFESLNADFCNLSDDSSDTQMTY